MAGSLVLEEWDENYSINRKTKVPKNIYKFFQNIFGGVFALGIITLMIGVCIQLAFNTSLSSRYIKLDELNKLPILKDGGDAQRDYFKKLASQYVVNVEKQQQNQSKFNYIVERGPDLAEVTLWLVETIKDKPYEKQNVADEKLKLINDL